jgi:lipopolysaccharide biosynthesis regulator YciM
VNLKISSIEYLLDIDIKALGEIVSILFECYKKLARTHEFENVCERLRVNIKDARWQRRMTYYQIISKLNNNWPNSSQYMKRKT